MKRLCVAIYIYPPTKFRLNYIVESYQIGTFNQFPIDDRVCADRQNFEGKNNIVLNYVHVSAITGH